METTVNERISELIDKLELSPNAFATQIGVKTTVIYNIQKNRNKPGYDLLKKIIERYNVDGNWLIAGFGKINTNDLIRVDKSVNLNVNNDVNLNGKNDQKTPQNQKDYMRLLIQQSKEKRVDYLANYYEKDPIGIKSKHLADLKEKYTRRFNREAVKENESLYLLSNLVDHLGDTIEMVLELYLDNINDRPNPFETSQYFDLQNDTINIPDTVDYDDYKNSVIKWLESIRVYEPVITEYYNQSLSFLESIDKAPDSTVK